MKTYKNLYQKLCGYDNLHLAFNKARKHKTQKQYVIDFQKNLKNNLLQLRADLLFHSYKPKPLETFILRDPKTRKISKSDFRDRVVHHAICSIIEPILEKKFIHDSYANRKGKGTLAAIKRFEHFKRKVSKNQSKISDGKNIKGYVLKADVRHFFDTVKHDILIKILKRNIKDPKFIWLIKIILSNHQAAKQGQGMPLGNLTSQFFANVYLNELDQFVKHKLKAQHYIRYVDDFVILHRSKEVLEEYLKQADSFLQIKLDLQIHPDKSKISLLYQGTNFLGLKIFSYHKILQKRNSRKFNNKLKMLCKQYKEQSIDYDKIYNFLEGWIAYSKNANTYSLRQRLLNPLAHKFEGQMSTKEINRYMKSMP